MNAGRTVIDRIWDEHVVRTGADGTSLLFIDRIMLHERTGPATLTGLEVEGHAVAHPDRVIGTMDHIVDTTPGRSDDTLFKGGTAFIREFREAAHRARIPLYDLGDPRQGISHVTAPEQGFILPGVTAVCADSHTCTLGGLGALAWGIGSTECEHAVATQSLERRKPKRMKVEFRGRAPRGVQAKDLVLALIGRHGAAGGDGHAIEFTGESVRALGVEARMTLCNMGVEFGAFTGLVAADDGVYDWLAGRPRAPVGADWDAAVAHWRTLRSDDDAEWDRVLTLDVDALTPQVTWGTSPEHVVGIDARVPDIDAALGPGRRASMEKAFDYMDVKPGQPLEGLPIEAAFIGSCTNSRVSDLAIAAEVVRGRRIAPGVLGLVVPGSSQVKREAEALGLDRVFLEAGFQWRESGCSLCFFAGGDSFGSARRVISSTNRNFENRQGRGVRTHLANPATVAASAIAGRIADARPYLAA